MKYFIKKEVREKRKSMCERDKKQVKKYEKYTGNHPEEDI
jgi:hypothetical protein